MTTGRNNHRIVAGLAAIILLGTGTAVSSCSGESTQETSSSASTESSGASGSSASSLAVEGSTAAPTSSDTQAAEASGSESSGVAAPGNSSEPSADAGRPLADPSEVVLGASDAPAGFTWVDSNTQATNAAANEESLKALTQMLDAMTFSPESCQQQMRKLSDPAAAAGAGGATALYQSQDGQSAAVVAVGPQAEGNPHACDNATATGTVDGVPLNIRMVTSDLGVTIDGADDVTATRTETTVDAAGQSQTTSQSTIVGNVNGTWFSVGTQGAVDQSVLIGLAQAQVAKIKG